MHAFITITGHKHYYGLIPFTVGAVFSLVPEHENFHDSDAIAVLSPVYGKVGYVANQKETMAEGTLSASLCRNFLSKSNSVTVRFLAGEYIIAELMP